MSTEEAEGAVRLLCDVGDVGTSFRVFRQQDAEVRVCWDMLEDGIVEGIEERGSALDDSVSIDIFLT